MNDLIPSTRVEGEVLYHGEDLYADVRRPGRGPAADRDGVPEAEPVPEVDLRQRRVRAADQRLQGQHRRARRASLRRAALWDEVKDKLKQSGLALSGGQQQRLCIARAIATEPTSSSWTSRARRSTRASTLQIEELMAELKENYTIVIVTHNMQQAARASDQTVFLTMAEDRAGYVVEQGPTLGDLHQPEEPADRGLRLRPVRLSGGNAR